MKQQALLIEHRNDGTSNVELDGVPINGVRRITFDMTYSNDKKVVIDAGTQITLFPSIVNLKQIGIELKAELLCTQCGNSDFITMENDKEAKSSHS